MMLCVIEVGLVVINQLSNSKQIVVDLQDSMSII